VEEFPALLEKACAYAMESMGKSEKFSNARPCDALQVNVYKAFGKRRVDNNDQAVGSSQCR